MKSLLNLKTSIITLVIVVLAVVAGQLSFAQGSNERTVVITINSSAENGYTVDPYDLYIPARVSNVPIKFTLNGDNYEFLSSEGHGFQINDDTGEFKVQSLGGNKKRLMVIDKNRVAKEYYYTITVINTVTNETLLIDPRIQNGGGGGND